MLKRMLACAVCTVFVLAAATGSERDIIHKDTASAAATMTAAQSKISDAQKKIAELREKQAELDKQIAETEGDLEKEQENQKAIEEQIQTVQETLLALENSSTAMRENISLLTVEIVRLADDVSASRLDVESGINSFKTRLRLLYITGSSSYADVILGADDFFDMLMKLELVKRVTVRDAEILQGLIDKKNNYESAQAELIQKREEVTDQLAKLEEQTALQHEQMDKLSELYSKSKEMIEKLEKDKEAFTADQKENTARQEAFEAELSKLLKEQEALKKADEEKKRREQEAQQGGSNGNNSGGNSSGGNSGGSSGGSTVAQKLFTWPVPGHYYISYGVGWRWGAYHKGIDIYTATIRGAAICAAADGKVIKVSNNCIHDWGKNGNCCGDGYGNYCIIDHGNGYVTLYGHSEKITVSPGQYVKQGDKLGTVGSTGYSTGPHLHFEIRYNGQIMNPKDYF